jgi:peptidase E
MTDSKKEQQIWERWITIENYDNYPELAHSLADFQGSHLLGYVYIDHDAGTTLDLVKTLTKLTIK